MTPHPVLLGLGKRFKRSPSRNPSAQVHNTILTEETEVSSKISAASPEKRHLWMGPGRQQETTHPASAKDTVVWEFVQGRAIWSIFHRKGVDPCPELMKVF
jgi:hypothetical protein